MNKNIERKINERLPTKRFLNLTSYMLKLNDKKILRNIVPWNENPNIASTRMSKLSDKFFGKSSNDKKGTDSDSS